MKITACGWSLTTGSGNESPTMPHLMQRIERQSSEQAQGWSVRKRFTSLHGAPGVCFSGSHSLLRTKRQGCQAALPKLAPALAGENVVLPHGVQQCAGVAAQVLHRMAKVDPSQRPTAPARQCRRDRVPTIFLCRMRSADLGAQRSHPPVEPECGSRSSPNA